MRLAAKHGWMTTPVNETLLNSLLAQLPNSGCAVDLGCGAALFGQCMSERGLHTVAVDISPAVCAAVSTRVPTLETRCMALQDSTPFQPFDVVVCLGLGPTDDLAAHLRQLANWGRAGTTVLASAWIQARQEVQWRRAHIAANMRITKEWHVSIADWIRHEDWLVRQVAQHMPQSHLSDKMRTFVDDVLPQLAAEQHFCIFQSRINH